MSGADLEDIGAIAVREYVRGLSFVRHPVRDSGLSIVETNRHRVRRSMECLDMGAHLYLTIKSGINVATLARFVPDHISTTHQLLFPGSSAARADARTLSSASGCSTAGSPCRHLFLHVFNTGAYLSISSVLPARIILNCKSPTSSTEDNRPTPYFPLSRASLSPRATCASTRIAKTCSG